MYARVENRRHTGHAAGFAAYLCYERKRVAIAQQCACLSLWHGFCACAMHPITCRHIPVHVRIFLQTFAYFIHTLVDFVRMHLHMWRANPSQNGQRCSMTRLGLLKHLNVHTHDCMHACTHGQIHIHTNIHLY